MFIARNSAVALFDACLMQHCFLNVTNCSSFVY